MDYEYSEKDWKLFRKKLPEWQESFMEKLNREYIRILTDEGTPSARFWKLEKRINEDKKFTGVQCQSSRSEFVFLIRNLLGEGAITLNDLSEFSEGLQEKMRQWTQRSLDEGGI